MESFSQQHQDFFPTQFRYFCINCANEIRERLMNQEFILEKLSYLDPSLVFDRNTRTNLNAVVDKFANLIESQLDSTDLILHQLSSFALNFHTLPLSTVEVERDFSSITRLKTKVRYRLHIETLDCLLAIRTGLKLLNITSDEFSVPDELLKFVENEAGSIEAPPSVVNDE